MKKYLKIHPWKIIEHGFDPANQRLSESNFSIGNGVFGQRANFEETYTGDHLQGSYIAGVYYPDKTRVGWWKNGYPEYFAKVLNAPNWIGLKIEFNREVLDLGTATSVKEFERVLDMRNGLLSRRFVATLANGIKLEIVAKRFCSLAETNYAALSYQVSILEGKGGLSVESFTDGRIVNSDSNYNNKFWAGVLSETDSNETILITRTRKTDYHVGFGTYHALTRNGEEVNPSEGRTKKKFVAVNFRSAFGKGDVFVLEKRVAILSSLYSEKEHILSKLKAAIKAIKTRSFVDLLAKSEAAWEAKWQESDIQIVGDDEAQQGIRFNIFQLNCTYNGEDERLNIGPKGFTGEKYGGSTYWDTEAYCLPFYQSTANPKVARNLLLYRYKHLQKAIENAEKLGFTGGAALFPMVTMNGEECHNEWEITFEEIHRNGAIAYAIYDYIRYTGDRDYLASNGLEVLIAIARFWAQRVNWSADKQQYVMLGVTGPNEFENNVNNNWYTNRLAAWCLKYAKTSMEEVRKNHANEYRRVVEVSGFREEELLKWTEIAEKMYYPFSEAHGVFLQQDGFLDKELIPVSELPASERPIVEHWSWDRILRSCYIKQADVLQGFYFFEDEFDQETLRRHYDFYEPFTVHESSLSPCVHSILASKLGDEERAYAFYLRTARLDLDDYNNDTRDGLHITSMAGTWMSIVKGFAGMRVKDHELVFKPFLPSNWKEFSFNVRFRGESWRIRVDAHGLNKEKL